MYGINKENIHKKKKKKYQYDKPIEKMFNFNDAVKHKKDNQSCPQVLDYLYIILIIGDSASEKQTHYLI